eukprot:gene25599-34163_t
MATHECSGCLRETIQGATEVDATLILPNSICTAPGGRHTWTEKSPQAQEGWLPILWRTVFGGSSAVVSRKRALEDDGGHAISAATDYHWYWAETMLTTFHKGGLRASVYIAAGKSGAFHSNEDKTNEVKCGIFQTTLEGLVMRYFDAEATIVHNRTYTAVIWSPNLMAVLPSDYVSVDNPDSDDFSLLSVQSDYDAVDVDIRMQPRLWESADLSCFSGGCKGKRCYLMSQTSYIQHASNENNILIMSAENHFRFFGENDPKIAIKWVRETDQVVTIDEEEQTFCEIQIVFDSLTYTTSVAVPTPSLFKQFLTFKYLETLELQQQSVKPENKLAKIAGVRATVIERMRSEFGDDLTIDLNVKKKVWGCLRETIQGATEVDATWFFQIPFVLHLVVVTLGLKSLHKLKTSLRDIDPYQKMSQTSANRVKDLRSKYKNVIPP